MEYETDLTKGMNLDFAHAYTFVSSRTSKTVPFVVINVEAGIAEHEFELIVMGTHGRGPVTHALMGSVAERVVRSAPCPVLTIRHPTHRKIAMDRLLETSATAGRT